VREDASSVPRATVFTASIGAGHDLPAELLAAELRDDHGWEVEVVDALVLAGGPLQRAITGTTFESPLRNRLFDLEHRLLHDFTPTHRIAGVLGELLAGRQVLRHLRRVRPDVIVSTYPGSTEVTGRLRRDGRLPIPCVAAITDLAALRFWACRGIDLHLVTQAESIPEVRAIAGPATEIRHVRGLSDPRFATEIPSRARARAGLELPEDVPVAVVSGGGWAVGDLAGAAEAVLSADPRARVLILCGTSEPRRAELTARFTGEPRVRALGFTDRMPDVLVAADALIHSTAGLTVMEALIVGCPVISYGWGVGHIRANNAAFAAHGLATVVRDRAGLGSAVLDAFAHPGRPDPSFAMLPTAAAAIARRYG
jgi:UDP-N-acetylglucosamine:LPS N-acetylglucosamine transferase